MIQFRPIRPKKKFAGGEGQGSSHENYNWRSPRTARTSLRRQQRRLGQEIQRNRVGPAD